MRTKKFMTYGYVAVKHKGYHLRASGSKKAASLGIAEIWTRLPYLGETSIFGWHRVLYEGKPAWIYRQAGTLTVVEQRFAIARRGNKWRVRSAPDGKAAVLGTVKGGEKLVDQGETQNNYRLVIFNNQNGWLHNRAIEKE